MQVFLQILTGPAAGKRTVLRVGHVARVGRTEWADFSVASDSEMSEVHFAIQCEIHGCRLRDLDSSTGTLVNGKKVTDVELHHGDTITAGGTEFSVTFLGGPAATASPSDAIDAAEADAVAGGEPTDLPPQTAADYCQELELSDDAMQVLVDDQQPEEFLKTLIENEFFADAITFLAFLLPKPEAVAWASHCVRDVLSQPSPPEIAALDAADKWVAEPNDENRRAAHAAAENTEYSGAASWVALSVFWSGGSLAPPDLPEVPPANGLTAKGVAAALMLAATVGPPVNANEQYRVFFDNSPPRA